MAYVTGTANTIGEVTNAIISACTANGWTLTAADVISKGDAFIKITTDATNVMVVFRAGTGYSAGALVSPCPKDCYLSKVLTSEILVFPIIYYINIKDYEVYVLCNWGTDKWTSIGFGISKIPGAPATGVWISGVGKIVQTGGIFSWAEGCHNSGYSSSGYAVVCGLFTRTTHNANLAASTDSGGCYVHAGFPDWTDDINGPITLSASRQLNYIDNPSINPTGQTVLVPIQPYIDRGSSKKSIIIDLLHARYVRLDTLNAGDIVIFGSDRWKVYPLYKRDAVNRNGVTNTSGTFGYAIRYDGP